MPNGILCSRLDGSSIMGEKHPELPYMETISRDIVFGNMGSSEAGHAEGFT